VSRAREPTVQVPVDPLKVITALGRGVIPLKVPLASRRAPAALYSLIESPWDIDARLVLSVKVKYVTAGTAEMLKASTLNAALLAAAQYCAG
jgi:hypothetical protein